MDYTFHDTMFNPYTLPRDSDGLFCHAQPQLAFAARSPGKYLALLAHCKRMGRAARHTSNLLSIQCPYQLWRDRKPNKRNQEIKTKQNRTQQIPVQAAWVMWWLRWACLPEEIQSVFSTLWTTMTYTACVENNYGKPSIFSALGLPCVHP